MKQLAIVCSFALVLLASALLNGVATLEAQDSKPSAKGAWEYKTLLRSRTAGEANGFGEVRATSAWRIYVSEKEVSGAIEVVLNQLGAQGWEVASVAPRSSAYSDYYAGFTTEELWVLKRRK